MYAKRDQVFDLCDIAAALLRGQNAALERCGNYLNCLMGIAAVVCKIPFLDGPLKSHTKAATDLATQKCDVDITAGSGDQSVAALMRRERSADCDAGR
jgi:phage-related minor tail protein